MRGLELVLDGVLRTVVGLLVLTSFLLLVHLLNTNTKWISSPFPINLIISRATKVAGLAWCCGEGDLRTAGPGNIQLRWQQATTPKTKGLSACWVVLPALQLQGFNVLPCFSATCMDSIHSMGFFKTVLLPISLDVVAELIHFVTV